MKIIKRNGTEAVFDSGKIRSAVLRANACVKEADRISEEELRQIADQVTDYCRQLDRTPDVEEVQDQVERQLMAAIPQEDWREAHHWLIFHGRRVCHSQKPDCAHCTLRQYCPEGKTGL